MNQEVILAIGIIVLGTILNVLYLHQEHAKTRIFICLGLAAVWITAVITMAYHVCSFATTIRECFIGWCIAFVLGCILAGFEILCMMIGNPKRKLTEKDKMKLRDI